MGEEGQRLRPFIFCLDNRYVGEYSSVRIHSLTVTALKGRAKHLVTDSMSDEYSVACFTDETERLVFEKVKTWLSSPSSSTLIGTIMEKSKERDLVDAIISGDEAREDAAWVDVKLFFKGRQFDYEDVICQLLPSESRKAFLDSLDQLRSAAVETFDEEQTPEPEPN